ncbi:MAG: hypothetical protein M1352_02300 [Patescibacteria group bacterium]|nr:hypothetical protein [Patescibacteria group bacterium]
MALYHIAVPQSHSQSWDWLKKLWTVYLTWLDGVTVMATAALIAVTIIDAVSTRIVLAQPNYGEVSAIPGLAINLFGQANGILVWFLGSVAFFLVVETSTMWLSRVTGLILPRDENDVIELARGLVFRPAWLMFVLYVGVEHIIILPQIRDAMRITLGF